MSLCARLESLWHSNFAASTRRIHFLSSEVFVLQRRPALAWALSGTLLLTFPSSEDEIRKCILHIQTSAVPTGCHEIWRWEHSVDGECRMENSRTGGGVAAGLYLQCTQNNFRSLSTGPSVASVYLFMTVDWPAVRVPWSSQARQSYAYPPICTEGRWLHDSEIVVRSLPN
jgi:hypothetical protein